MGRMEAKEEIVSEEAAIGRPEVPFPPTPTKEETEFVASFPPLQVEPEPVVSFPPAQGETEPVASFPPLQVEPEPVVSFPPAQGETEPVASFPPLQVEPEPVVSFPPNAAAAAQPAPFIGIPWQTGLFDCNQDPTNTVMTFILPCVTFGQISEVLDAGQSTCPMGSLIYAMTMPVLCFWVLGSKYRTRLRSRYGLVEAPYQDVISHLFCPCCSLSQEFRELQKRGLDPALGWNGILAQQQTSMQYGNQQMQTPPHVQTMSM